MRVVSLTGATAIPAIQLFQSQQQLQQSPLLRGGGGAFSISIRKQICFRSQQRLLFFEVKSSVESSSTVVDDELQDFRVVTSNVLTAEKEETKEVLTMFLRKQLGLSNETVCFHHLTRFLLATVVATSFHHLYPRLLTCSIQMVKATVDYLYEMGLSSDKIGKVLTCFLQIMGLSLDDNLHPTAEYFRSMGVNPTSLLSHYPTVFGLSIECKLKPVTEFFLNKGCSIDEIGTMASRFGCIYTLSLTKNLIPKWDFFLTMDYPRSEIVKYPSYFGHSLEGRIKPRYAQMKECGVKLSLHESFCTPDSKFEKILNRRVKKMLDSQHGSMTNL